MAISKFQNSQNQDALIQLLLIGYEANYEGKIFTDLN